MNWVVVDIVRIENGLLAEHLLKLYIYGYLNRVRPRRLATS